MSNAPLDIAASYLHSPPPRPKGRRRLGRWLAQLVELGGMLMERVEMLVAFRRDNPKVPRTTDLDRACGLVARAMQWASALQAKLQAEAKAARGLDDSRENLFDTPDWNEDLIRRPGTGTRTRRVKPKPDRCIDGKSLAEVVGQICADLTIAAVLLRSPLAIRQIAEIAAAARALLGGSDEAWQKPPAPEWRDRAANEAAVADMAAPAVSAVPVMAAVPAADTG